MYSYTYINILPSTCSIVFSEPVGEARIDVTRVNKPV